MNYPTLNDIPEPTGFSESTTSEFTKVLKMASGRRRVLSTMPGALYEGSLTWKLEPDEFVFFLGWWRWILDNGITPIEFDPNGEFAQNTGVLSVLLKTNTFKETEEAPGHKVTMSCYVLEEL